MNQQQIDELLDWLHDNDEKTIRSRVQALENDIEIMEDAILDAMQAGDVAEMADFTIALERTAHIYRLVRGYVDILFFAYEYFSANRNPQFRMNIIDDEDATLDNAPEFHRELCAELGQTVKEKRTKHLAWAAPRGTAKTSYLTEIFPIHEVVYRSRRHIVIISETISMAMAFLKYSSRALKENEKLRRDFGEVLYESSAQNREDNQNAFTTITNIRVTISSIDTQFRGATHEGRRPDLIILDDVESRSNTDTEEKRKKNREWFNKVIIPAMDIKKGALLFMGTIVQAESLLVDVLNRPTFDSQIFRSIISYPANPQLWQEWSQIFKDNEGGNGLRDSYAFYLEHQAAMEEGVAVIWPARFPYLELMKKKMEIGDDDFNSEYQNIATVDEGERVFNVDAFSYFEQHKVESKPGYLRRDLQIVSFWDPAAGVSKKGDYNAVLTVARDNTTGKIYVLDAWAKKCSYKEAMNYSLEVIKKYEPNLFGVESINSAISFYDQLVALTEQVGVYQRFKAIKPQTKKEDRIATLQPLFENETLKLRRTQSLLLDMLRDFPNGKHDDLPDALASAVALLAFKQRRVWSTKPEGL